MYVCEHGELSGYDISFPFRLSEVDSALVKGRRMGVFDSVLG